jgi:hypothetical protein
MSTEPSDRYDPVAMEGAAARPGPVEIDYSIPGDTIIIDAGEDTENGSRLTIRSWKGHADWVALTEWGTGSEPGRAPTAVQYRGVLYEITSARTGENGGGEYRLRPWPAHEPSPSIYAYSREAELTRWARDRQLDALAARARRLLPLYPLMGFLPGEMQKRIAGRWPVDIQTATRASAALAALFGVYLAFFGGVLGVLGALTQTTTPLSPDGLLGLSGAMWALLSPYFMVSGAVRWLRAGHGRVSGDPLLELLWRAM